jgi:uncharacterized phiE125 gp8 family phage protein
VKARLRIDFEDDDIENLIDAAVSHAEKYTNTKLAQQTVEVKCDSFSDFDRLSIAPVKSVSSVTYVAPDGTVTTLDPAAYELRADDLEVSISAAYGARWPAIRQASRITVTAVVGYDQTPAAVKHAMLLWIGDAYENRENATLDDWTALDALLSNFRRGA